MIYVAAVQFVLIAGLVWMLDQRHTREVASIRGMSEQYAVERADHLARLDNLTSGVLARCEQPHPDLKELVGIVDRLCQRIQAPDAAVTEHAMAQPLPDMPQVVMPDDDRAWWESQGFQMPKEQLAEQLDG